MLVLSIDCGVQNFAWVIYDVNQNSLVSHGLLSETCRTQPNVESIIKSIEKCFQAIENHKITDIIIERQPMMTAKNPVVQCAAMCMAKIYFNAANVHVFDPKIKNKYLLERGDNKDLISDYTIKSTKTFVSLRNAKYKLNKNMSVEYCKGIDVAAPLLVHKKNDDLCDALVQCLAWVAYKI